MYSGIAYAVTCTDGAGNLVKQEEAYLDDLDQVYMPLSEFIGWRGADSIIDDALDRMTQPHYAQDLDEPALTWELRAYPLLKMISTCSQ